MRRLGLEMIVLKAGTESEIESAFVAAVQQQAKALTIAADAYLSSRSRQIAFFALRQRPASIVGAWRDHRPRLIVDFCSHSAGHLSADWLRRNSHPQRRETG